MWCFSLGTDVAHVLSLQKARVSFVHIYNRQNTVLLRCDGAYKTLRDLVNMRVLIQLVRDGAQESAFLTSSQENLMLLVSRPHFEVTRSLNLK